MKMYGRSEVYDASLKYFKGDGLAADTWINKYCLKDSKGNLYELTPYDMHIRLALEFSRIEQKYKNPVPYDTILDAMLCFNKLVPQGSPMAGIGNNMQLTSISNCLVVGNDEENSDSYGGICKIDQEIAQLQKRRAGVGTTLSYLRPAGTPVKNSALVSSGIIPYAQKYSNTTEEICQDGRKGALMLTLDINHPESEDFIDAKLNKKKITGANISVQMSDLFMNHVESKSMHTFKFPTTVKLSDATYTVEKDAYTLWKKIIHNAWACGEPGVLFWDTVIRESIPDCYDGFGTVSTNPCGEIPLCPDDSCRLLAINLYGYINNPFTDQAIFDWVSFKKDVILGQRLMDDIVDLELEKIDAIIKKIDTDPEDDNIKSIEKDLWIRIKEKCINGRRTGFGPTAEGDMLAALGLRYGTKNATQFSNEVHMKFKHYAYESSVILAEERGAFPIYNASLEEKNPFIKRIKSENPELHLRMTKSGRRNIALLTVAPTGSVSIMTQTTSGIEPAFAIMYKRRRKLNANDKDTNVDFVDPLGFSWQEYNVFHHKFNTWLVANGYDLSVVEHLSKEEMDPIIKKSPYYKATANDVDWVEKIEMQGKIQKHIDHSISVTVNLPNNVSEDIVEKVYMTAWKVGCKGCTIYRDGSRSGVLITDSDKKDEQTMQFFKDNNAPKRPKTLNASILRFSNQGEKWIALIGLYDDRPYEIFSGNAEEFEIPKEIEKGEITRIKMDGGKSKYIFTSDNGDEIEKDLTSALDPHYHNYSKMISGILRHGMPIEYVINLVDTLHLGEDRLDSWKSGVTRALKKFVKDGTKAKSKSCQICGAEFIYIEGCLQCQGCGSTKCG
jgi:ribonucleoside-diphosphate reductase alpha chain